MTKNFTTRRDALQVRAYRCATTAATLMVLVQSLGAGKKWW